MIRQKAVQTSSSAQVLRDVNKRPYSAPGGMFEYDRIAELEKLTESDLDYWNGEQQRMRDDTIAWMEQEVNRGMGTD